VVSDASQKRRPPTLRRSVANPGSNANLSRGRRRGDAGRWRQLIALARVTASECGYPATGYVEACKLMKK
jgi:hypothetical protein